MKSSIDIHVTFLAGTAIKDAILEATTKALTWEVAWVSFDFNGVKMSISARCNISEALEEFHKVLSSKDNYKSVIM